MTGLWLPPSARRYPDDVEAVLADSSPEARQLAAELEDLGVSFTTDETFGATVGPDSGVILLARGWGRMALDDGRDVMSALVESKPLERMILDGHVQAENAGVVETAEHPMVQACCPALWLQLRQFNVFVPLERPEQARYPGDWRTAAPGGFAIAVAHPDPTEERALYIATPELRDAHGLTLANQRGPKVGRNDKCPCGSGLKFKRCHG